MNKRVLLLSAVFAVLETAYFGWNMTPQSNAEMVCDGITIVIAALAFIPSRRQKKPPPQFPSFRIGNWTVDFQSARTSAPQEEPMASVHPRNFSLMRAKEDFHKNPTNETAGRYLRVLIEYELADLLGDDGFFNALAEIAAYLDPPYSPKSGATHG